MPRGTFDLSQVTFVLLYECRLLISPGGVQTVQHNPDNQDRVNTLDAIAGAASVMLQITLWTRAPVLQDAGAETHTASPPFCALTTTLTLIQHLHQARKIHESNLQVPCALVSIDIDGWRLLRAYQKLFLINKMN